MYYDKCVYSLSTFNKSETQTTHSQRSYYFVWYNTDPFQSQNAVGKIKLKAAFLNLFFSCCQGFKICFTVTWTGLRTQFQVDCQNPFSLFSFPRKMCSSGSQLAVQIKGQFSFHCPSQQLLFLCPLMYESYSSVVVSFVEY